MSDNWISVDESLPKVLKPVFAYVVCKNGYEYVQRAAYTPPKTVLAGIFLSDDYDTSELEEYVEEQEDYYVVEGWWEESVETDASYRITGTVTHWMPLPAAPKREER